jgi:pimeloyl-ACP methyl ester carboxylesterase
MTANVNYRSEAGYRLAMETYEKQLDAWPLPTERHFVQTTIGETFVVSWGESAEPPLVLLHGSAANSSTWGGDAARFATAFRIHAVDLPGETGKSTPTRPTYGGSAYSEWLTEVLDAIGLPRVSLVGLSLGGWAALRFAAASPERVERLVLLAPGGIAPSRKKFLAYAAFYGLFGGRGAREITKLVFSPQPAPPGMAEGFAFMLKHYRARHDNLPLITDAELSRLSAPALFIGGTKDALLDMPSSAERFSRLVPHGLAELDPMAGHALLDQGARVLEFLTSRETRPESAAAHRGG